MLKRLMCIGASILLVACSQEDWLLKIAPADQQAIARNYIEQLRSRDFADIEKAADPSIAAALSGGALEKMAALIPQGPATSVKLVGANRFSTDKDGTMLNLTYEFQFGDKFMLINVARKMKDGVEMIVGFRVQPLPASLEQLNRFTLSNKSAVQYAVLAASVAAALFTLYALVVCIRTKLARRKWLWILFILFGFGKIMVNWTTGAWDFRIIALQLFSASSAAAFFGPWIISVSLPVGAIFFLSRRKELAAYERPNEAAASGDDLKSL
jgi:hypothetical protein